MNTWLYYETVARDRESDLLREARQERLVQEAEAGKDRSQTPRRRLLAWLGRHLAQTRTETVAAAPLVYTGEQTP